MWKYKYSSCNFTDLIQKPDNRYNSWVSTQIFFSAFANIHLCQQRHLNNSLFISFQIGPTRTHHPSSEVKGKNKTSRCTYRHLHYKMADMIAFHYGSQATVSYRISCSNYPRGRQTDAIITCTWPESAWFPALTGSCTSLGQFRWTCGL